MISSGWNEDGGTGDAANIASVCTPSPDEAMLHAAIDRLKAAIVTADDPALVFTTRAGNPGFACFGHGLVRSTRESTHTAPMTARLLSYRLCACTFAVVAVLSNAACGTSRGGADAGSYCTSLSQPPTPEDVTCTTNADCAVRPCEFCCGFIEVGVNKSSTYECGITGSCPIEPKGCSPEAHFTPDCREVTDSVGVACLNHQCRTFETSTDASTRSDASDGG
jgi:hypothetical protein